MAQSPQQAPPNATAPPPTSTASSTSVPPSSSSPSSFSAALIIVLWRHRLSLNGFAKPNGVRLIVVGPSELVVNEEQVDAIHHVEGPITARDQNHAALLQKTREQCAALENVPRALCVFERLLQRPIGQIRADLGIAGLMPDQFDQLMHRQSVRAICRRGGLQTLRCCSFGSVQGKPDEWVSHANSQVGSYPMFLRPVSVDQNCLHTLAIARSGEELKAWIRARPQSSNFAEIDYLVEECLADGIEFVAIASARTGLIGTFCSADPRRTLICSVLTQSPYAIEYLSAERTRDELPGAESFVMQTLKTIFVRSAVSPLVFVKAFYQGHNTITFLGGAYELRKRSLASLFAWANGGMPWEVISLRSMAEALAEQKPLTESAQQNGFVAAKPNLLGQCHSLSIASTNHLHHHLPIHPMAQSSSLPAAHFALINFPNCEGVLLHQTAISLRPFSSSQMRVAWRVSEGEELLDADGMDDNVLQIYVSNPNRTELLRDIADLCRRVEIPVDRNSMACCAERRVPICRRDLLAIANSPGSPFTSGHQLIRSYTTAD